MRLRSKIIILLLLFSVIPVAAVVWVGEHQGSEMLMRQVGESGLEFARLALLRINEHLYEGFEDVQNWGAQITHIESVGGQNTIELSHYLVHLPESSDEFLYAAALDKSGVVYAATDEKLIGMDMSDLNGFKEGLAGRASISDVSYDNNINEYSMLMTAPICDDEDGDKVTGVVLGAASWKNVHEMITSLGIDGKEQDMKNHVMLINSEGLVISCAEPDSAFKKNLNEIGMRSAKEVAGGKEGYLLETNEHGNMAFSMYTFAREYKDLPKLGWGLIVHRDKDVVFAAVQHMRIFSMIVVIVFVALSALFAILIGRNITSGLDKISAGAAAIGGGDLQRRICVERKDEIGLLAESFNDMASKLASSVRWWQKAEGKLRITTERLSLSIENMLDGYALHEAIFDNTGRMADFKYLEFNSAAQRIVGISKEEIIGKTALELFPHIVERGLMDKYADVIATGESAHIEDFYYEGDSLVIAFDISCYRVDNEHFVCVFRDITERKLSMDKLRESNRVYSTLCENIPGMVYRSRPDWSIEFVSNSEAVCGYSPEDLCSNKVKWLDIVHPDDSKTVMNKALTVTSKLSASIQEYRIIAKDGSVRWVEDHKSSIYVNKGVFDGVDGVVFDITERKQAEEALKESEQSLAMAQQVACVGSWDWDILNDKVVWSDETYRQMGLKPNEIELTYETFSKFVHPEDVEQVNEAVRVAIEENKPYSLDVRMIRKDGTEWVMHAQWLIKKNDDGKTVRFVGTQQDITERKHLETERERYREQVIENQKHAYVSSMGAIVAHELNQPLTMINILLGRASENLKKMSCCPDPVRDVRESLAQVKEATSIIRKFRRHSKTAGVESIETVSLDIIANRIISMLSERANHANIKISTKGLDELPEVYITETILEQMLLIIIQNAIDAADGNKQHQLNIAGSSTDSTIELEFADDCCGIASEDVERVFEPFFSTKSEDKGMGLGLEIVQQILISCGGRIRVESKPGKGTTFFISLPRDKTIA